MEISVIIPTYEICLSTLERLVRYVKIQAQPYGASIFVVCNDEKENIVQKKMVEGLGAVHLYQNLKGSYAARNLGIEFSSYNSICVFLDSDCLPKKNWLSHLVNDAESNPQSIIAGGVDITSRSIGFAESYEKVVSMNQRANVMKGHAITANLAVPRQVFDSIGLFDAELYSGGDVEFTRRAVKSGYNLFYSRHAVVEHPARNAEEVFKKLNRVVGGLHRIKVASGGNFGFLDIAKCLPRVVTIFIGGRKVSAMIFLKALFFSFRIELYRAYLMVVYATGLKKDYPRR